MYLTDRNFCEILEFDLRLELATGTLEGCIRASLTATTDGSDTDTMGTSGTGDTADSGSSTG